MKKYLLTFILTISLLSLASAAPKDSKIITLKSGSTLKGKVIQLKDGIYTLEIPDLGRMDIPEANILSITSLQAPASQYSQSDGDTKLQKARLKSQVNQIQGDLLSDPEFTRDLQNIVNDKEVQSMLSDPQLLNDVLSYDPERIQQNDSVQELMKKKSIQELMEKVRQKLPAQQ
jgi:hypothetical protein